MTRYFRAVLIAAVLVTAQPAFANDPVHLKFQRTELIVKWRARIQGLLDRGIIPLIDMETSITEDQVADELPDALKVMDEVGLALIAADGYQRPKDGSQGYRWSTYILGLVNAHPDRFVPAANGGTNPNWLNQKGGQPHHFIDQMEAQIRSGVYAHMGEFDFRHYMSSNQCKRHRFDRDNDIPLNGKNGHRVFKLAEETGVPFVIHLEPEDQALAALEEMLKAYPKAKLIVAHFGQIRHPGREKRFGPELVRKLLSTYPNLTYDLAAGGPNRSYPCSDVAGDTVIWDGPPGNQQPYLAPAYKALLIEFSGRFVTATDFGGGRKNMFWFIRDKVAQQRLILKDLPDAVQHAIAYRNAWKLLTGEDG